MNEQPTTVEPVEPVEPVEAEGPVASVDSVGSHAESAAEAAPAKKPVRRGRIAAIAGSVLLAGAVIGGAGYTVVTVQDADRDAGAPTWKFPKAAKDDAKAAKAASGLAAMLVPYDDISWSRGPDIAEFGADVSLSGGQATALRKESLRDLPRSQRRELEKQIDKEPTKGMVMRSYLHAESATDSVLASDSVYTVSIVLAQMKDQATVRDMSTFQNDFLDAVDIFRKGPEIEGHKNAKCFLPPKEADSELDMMVCSAYQGDVLVSATASGVKPLDTKGVATLLREQLDRIAEPGEAV